MNIGKALKQLRKKKGVSQIELAKECQITQTALSQIESGAKRPNSSTVARLCEYFQIPEPVLYILATDSSDIPPERLEIFNLLFPNIQDLVFKIMNYDEKEG